MNFLFIHALYNLRQPWDEEFRVDFEAAKEGPGRQLCLTEISTQIHPHQICKSFGISANPLRNTIPVRPGIPLMQLFDEIH